jgi:asparagine synthase (glutamine-hydrolysing)
VIRVSADASALLPQIVPHLCDLIADTSVFPTYLLARAAREEVTVALSGDGGDELFGGYDTYAAERLSRRYERLPRRLRGAIAMGVLGALRPSSEKKKGLRNRLRRFVEGERLPSDLAHYRWMVFLDSAARAELHGEALAAATRDKDPLDPVRWAFSRAIARDPDARGMEVDLRLYLPDDILVKVDRMSMAHSLEVRVPMLDYRVVELAQRIPVSLRGGAFRRKEVLRRAAVGLVPKETLRRGKEGFSAPVKRWLRGPLRRLLRERLLDGGGDDGLFRKPFLEKMIAEHDSLREDHAHRLFPILLFLLWRDCHIPIGASPAGRL